MTRAAKKYLRQVKKHLYCPQSLRKDFLRQLEDELLLFCEQQEETSYAQLAERFGRPEDVAADFFAEANPKTVSRFAYRRLKAAYAAFAIVILVALSIVGVIAAGYAQTQKLLSGAYEAETYLHPDGTECKRFVVRTNYRGRDVYWEYTACTGMLWLTVPPETWDGTEPYAVDIYLNENGTLEHWTFGQEHMMWIRVYDMGEERPQ